jgi:hypothetical protein
MSNEKNGVTPGTGAIVADARYRSALESWGRRMAAKAKAAELWRGAAARTAQDDRIEKEQSFSVRDLLQTALASRDAQAADVDWWSAVLCFYGDDARSRIELAADGTQTVLIIEGDRFVIPAGAHFPKSGRTAPWQQ